MSTITPAPGRRATLRTRLATALAVTAVAAGSLTGTVATAEPAVAATCSSSNFRDVPRSSAFYDAVTWMNCQGIAKGYGDGTFGANRAITRGEVATLLYRQVTPRHPKTGDRYFKDVPAGKHYTDAVNWMAQAGLSTGYAGRYFKPNQPITRGEVSALVYRLAGSTYAGRSSSPFRDMAKAQGFYKEATWMFTQGYISGYADWTFRPGRNITRAEAAKMLKNSHRSIAARGDVSSSRMSPLPITVERASQSTAAWKQKAADWATRKATDSRVFYKWGGNGPYGYDCSGFTTGAFSAGGESLPRTSKTQYTAADKHVPISKAEVGDLVYWSNNGKASGVYHVALVVEDDTIAHARNPNTGVTLTDIDYSTHNMLGVAGRFH